MKEKSLKLFILQLAIILILNFSLISFDITYAEDLFGMDKLSKAYYLLDNEDNTYDFTDISSHWAKTSLEKLSYIEILKGFPDNTMQPDKKITRAEFVTMIVRAIDLPITDYYAKYYDDIDASSWCYYHVSAAKKNGIIDIFSNNNFEPNKIISREEMAVIASKVLSYIPVSSNSIKFKDINNQYKYYEEISDVSALGIIKGFPDGTFNPLGNSTRAEAATIIQRILDIGYGEMEASDNILNNTAVNYEQTLIQEASIEGFSMKNSLIMSTGKERKQNYARSNTLREASAENSVNRNISDISAVVVTKSVYHAEVKISYDINITLNDDLLRTYKVNKSLFFIKKGEKWLVYNNKAEYGLIYAKDQHNINGKINLVWDYIYKETPVMSNEYSINGLNIISPTWFKISSEAGTIASTADISYSDWAHGNGYKVWALITNDFNKEMTSKFLKNPTAKQSAISQLLDFADTYELDGINVDFENMYTEDKALFVQFVKELYEAAKSKNLVISVDVTVIAPGSNWSACYDRAALAQVSDYIMLMAYDQHWGGSPISGSVAQLTWVEEKLKQVLKEVPADKLVLGVPFYTRLWKETMTAGSSQPVVTSKAISMETAEKEIADNNAVKVWDEQSGQYYATYSKDGSVYKIWLEDEKSIELKVKLVDKYQLAGVAAWRLGFETSDIWDVIESELN